MATQAELAAAAKKMQSQLTFGGALPSPVVYKPTPVQTWASGGPSPTQQTINAAKSVKGVTTTAPVARTATTSTQTQQAPAPAQTFSEPSAPEGPTQEEIMAAIDAEYNPAMDYLNQAEGVLRSDLPNVLQGAQDQYASGVGKVEAGRTSGLAQNAEFGVQASTRKEDALAASRRLYDELRRGYRQRFGGASSAGEAAFDLSGVEQQRQQGQTTRGYSDTVRQLDTQKTQIEDNFKTQMLDLDKQKADAIRQVNSDFQQKLLQIAQSKSQLATEKANMRLTALQTLRNQVMQIQMQNLQFQQTLQAQKAASDTAINQYAQQLALNSQYGSGAVGNYVNSTSTQPTSTLSLTPGQTAQTTQNYGGYYNTLPPGYKYDPATGKLIPA